MSQMIDLWSFWQAIVQSAVFDYPYYVFIWHVAGGIILLSLGDNFAQLGLCTLVICAAVTAALNGEDVEALGSQRSAGIARLVPQLAHSSCKSTHN